MINFQKKWKVHPRELVDAPSLEVFKASIDGALSNLPIAGVVELDDR